MKNIGKDFKELVNDTYIQDIAQGHLESWSDRYNNYKTKKEVEFDLNVNHDPSLEIERAEEDLKRELTTEENDKLISLFNKKVVKLFRKS